jgi:DNA polymerase-1
MEEDSTDSVNDRVLIIDGLNTYLRIFSSVPVISENGEHVGGIIGTLRSIAKEIRDFNPTRCIVVFDGKGGSMRRKKLHPDYKENRVGKYNLRREYFSTKEEEDAARHKQLVRLIQYLDLLPVQIVCIDHVEADDVIAYMTMQYFNSRANKIRIVSTDRDFLQLVSEQVEVYSPVKKKLYDLHAIEEEFGIHPKNYLLYRILDGDDSDNISGVPGIGLKTLKKYFPEVVSKVLDVEYLVNESERMASTEGRKRPSKIYQTILENKHIISRNMDLMQLQDTYISSISKVRIVEILQQPIPKVDKARMKIFLAEDYLHTSFSNFDGWLNSTFNTLNLWSTK